MKILDKNPFGDNATSLLYRVNQLNDDLTYGVSFDTGRSPEIKITFKNKEEALTFWRSLQERYFGVFDKNTFETQDIICPLALCRSVHESSSSAVIYLTPVYKETLELLKVFSSDHLALNNKVQISEGGILSKLLSDKSQVEKPTGLTLPAVTL